MNAFSREATDDFPVQTAAQWKALSHPLRLGILRLLAHQEQTNEELADALGVPSGKLHFHTSLLQRTGLIKLAGTRQKGPITEKLYRAVAQCFLASPALGATSAPLASQVESGLVLYQESWQQEPNLTQFGYHLIVPVSPKRILEFLERLKQLAEDFAASAETPELDASPLALTVLLHTVPIRNKTTQHNMTQHDSGDKT